MISSKYLVLFIILISRFILSPVSYAASPDSTAADSSLRNDGKEIKNIFIDNIDVSGPSLYDGKEWEPGFFGKAGNTLHLKTGTWVIRNFLLLKPAIS